MNGQCVLKSSDVTWYGTDSFVDFLLVAPGTKITKHRLAIRIKRLSSSRKPNIPLERGRRRLISCVVLTDSTIHRTANPNGM